MNVLSRIFMGVAMVGLLGYASGTGSPAATAAGVTVEGGVQVALAGPDHSAAAALPTATPIKHLVVIFQENASFDHYFGIYPHAANPPGEPGFTPLSGTPAVNGLTPQLLTGNPNAVQPFRLDRSQALTCSQVHNYLPEQQAEDGGKMDQFVQYADGTAGNARQYCPHGISMGYYDGNTVTALWNYAQHFAMSDNSFNTVFGPSTPGAINLVSGQTNGVTTDNNPGGATIGDGNGGLTDVGDADPAGDTCSTTTGETLQFSGKNIGDLLNAKGITWGFFEGGFNLATTNSAPNSSGTGCLRKHMSTVTNTNKADYIPHHQPFQYYASTANLTHARPTGAIGATDAANHQYDTDDFFSALAANNLPSVVFLKAPGYQDGHAGY